MLLPRRVQCELAGWLVCVRDEAVSRQYCLLNGVVRGAEEEITFGEGDRYAMVRSNVDSWNKMTGKLCCCGGEALVEWALCKYVKSGESDGPRAPGTKLRGRDNGVLRSCDFASSSSSWSIARHHPVQGTGAYDARGIWE